MPDLKLLALVIPTLWCDVTQVLELRLLRKTNVTFVTPLYTFFGELSGVKAPIRFLPLVVPYSGTLIYDMTLVLALSFLHKYVSILLPPPLVTPFGVAVRGKTTLKMLALASPYSGKPKVYATPVILTLVPLHK